MLVRGLSSAQAKSTNSLEEYVYCGVYLETNLGLVLIIIGIFMLISEVLEPGFFLAIPGTVLLVLGIAGVFAPGILLSVWAPILMVVVGVPVFIVTILFYKKFGPTSPPVTTVASSLKGKRGKTLVAVDPDSIKGKVKIDTQTWSATSLSPIPEGVLVEVVESRGVHVLLKEVEDPNMKGV